MTRVSSIVLALATVALATPCAAAGWTSWATPTQIDVVDVAPAGIMVHGAFEKLENFNCQTNNRIFIPYSHARFDEIYSAILAAQISGQQVRAWVSSCETQNWYGGTYGFVGGNHAVNIRN